MLTRRFAGTATKPLLQGDAHARHNVAHMPAILISLISGGGKNSAHRINAQTVPQSSRLEAFAMSTLP